MSQYYGNDSRLVNIKVMRGLHVDRHAADFVGYLNDRQRERQEMISENDVITTLLKSVHDYNGFKSNHIYYQDCIKYIKGADSSLKINVIKKLINAQNNNDKILKILDKVKSRI